MAVGKQHELLTNRGGIQPPSAGKQHEQLTSRGVIRPPSAGKGILYIQIIQSREGAIEPTHSTCYTS